MKRILPFAAALLLAGCAGAGVPQEQYESAVAEVAQLESENADIKQRILKMDSTRISLENEIETYTGRISTLERAVESYESLIDSMESQSEPEQGEIDVSQIEPGTAYDSETWDEMIAAIDGVLNENSPFDGHFVTHDTDENGEVVYIAFWLKDLSKAFAAAAAGNEELLSVHDGFKETLGTISNIVTTSFNNVGISNVRTEMYLMDSSDKTKSYLTLVDGVCTYDALDEIKESLKKND